MLNEEKPSSIPIDVFNLASHLRGLQWLIVTNGIDREMYPTNLNPVNSSGHFSLLSPDKMSVRYTGIQRHDDDVGAVQANYPAPVKRLAFYYEMTVKNSGQKGQMSIGFTGHAFKPTRHPGCESNSCGYHGNDGNLYLHGKGCPFGPTFTTGDTVGAGINYASQMFFFTKNGKLVGAASKDINSPLYPTVAVHSRNEQLTVNFGKQPFLFDIEAYATEQRLKHQARRESLSLPPYVSHRIIRSYLRHYGYEGTLNLFDVKNERMQENGFNEQTDDYALTHRKVLRQLIRQGYIDAAFQKLQEWYPQLVQDDDSIICFLLQSQQFIQYIEADKLEDAIDYARAKLAKYFDMNPVCELLEDVVAILAYAKPTESCVGYLFDKSQREFVADAVNAAVLTTNPDMKDAESCMQTCLEKLLKQLTLCSMEYRSVTGDQGEAVYIHKQLKYQLVPR